MPAFRLVFVFILGAKWVLAPPLTAQSEWQAVSDVTPPEPKREFRAAWIATVFNIDWPSQPGLSTWRQQKELTDLLDMAVGLHLNAIILQVRPAADAFYDSPLEPWSPYLSGKMGQGPDPYYDPLEFAVQEAHKRGLELHAWINPFRALTASTSYVDPAHLSQTRPDWIRPAGKLKWINPADPDARAHTLKVVADLVRRYPIDGIHIDDYFYPYPPNSKLGQRFPDDVQWDAYQQAGGELSRSDWRRQQINRFVESFGRTAKEQNPMIKVGISPFGIWRPNFPSTVKADLNAFEHLAADSRHWLQQGWVDYFSPQLYWSTSSTEQNFHDLVDWWNEQNTGGRHLWPGIASDRVGPKRPAREMVEQVNSIRERNLHSFGHIHWSISSLKEDRLGVASLLRESAYAEPALIPASPWIQAPPPQQPILQADDEQVTVIPPNGSTSPRWWLVQTRSESSPWNAKLIPGYARELTINPSVRWVAVRAVNAAGQLSSPIIKSRG